MHVRSKLSKFVGFTTLMAVTTVVAAPKAQAVSIFFNSTSAGAAQFDSTVTGAGNPVAIDPWSSLGSGTSIDRGAYSVSRISGGGLSPTSYGSLNGQVIDISPSSRNVQQSRASGIQFSFKNPVNALGFEVGDWAHAVSHRHYICHLIMARPFKLVFPLPLATYVLMV